MSLDATSMCRNEQRLRTLPRANGRVRAVPPVTLNNLSTLRPQLEQRVLGKWMSTLTQVEVLRSSTSRCRPQPHCPRRAQRSARAGSSNAP
jgi:hypothetical protein